MKNNNQIGQELSEFKPVELVGYEDEEAGSHDALVSRVVHQYGNYKAKINLDLFKIRLSQSHWL